MTFPWLLMIFQSSMTFHDFSRKFYFSRFSRFSRPCGNPEWWLFQYKDMMKWANGSIFRVTGPLCRGIHRSPVNSPHKGQWHGALMFSLTCTWINGWVNNHEASNLRRHHVHYDITVMDFPGMDIPIVKIRQSWDYLVFIMGIPVLLR